MLGKMRKSFGPVVAGAIIGAIALVFVFYGVYSPKTASRYSSGGAFAAKVNGETVGLNEFEREYRSRMEYYENMFKGKADLEILKKLGLRRQVLDELIGRKLALQEARKLGFVISDVEVREKIEAMTYFKKDGKFDPATYRQILAANRLSPPDFEETIRDDALRARAAEFIQGIPKASDRELRDEYFTAEDRRQVDYVFLDRAELRKKMVVHDVEIREFLKKPENLEQAKKYYEQAKQEYMKPAKKNSEKAAAPKKGEKAPPPEKPEYLTFEEAKRAVIIDVIKDRRTQELTKSNSDLAEEVYAKAEKSSPAEFKAYLKSKGLELKTSEKFNRSQAAIAGMGPVTGLITDAYRQLSPLEKHAVLYHAGVNHVVALNLRVFKPADGDFFKSRDGLAKSLQMKKAQQVYRDWMEEARRKSEIVVNKAVEAEGEAEDAAE